MYSPEHVLQDKPHFLTLYDYIIVDRGVQFRPITQRYHAMRVRDRHPFFPHPFGTWKRLKTSAKERFVIVRTDSAKRATIKSLRQNFVGTVWSYQGFTLRASDITAANGNFLDIIFWLYTDRNLPVKRYHSFVERRIVAEGRHHPRLLVDEKITWTEGTFRPEDNISAKDLADWAVAAAAKELVIAKKDLEDAKKGLKDAELFKYKLLEFTGRVTEEE